MIDCLLLDAAVGAGARSGLGDLLIRGGQFDDTMVDCRVLHNAVDTETRSWLGNFEVLEELRLGER